MTSIAALILMLTIPGNVQVSRSDGTYFSSLSCEELQNLPLTPEYLRNDWQLQDIEESFGPNAKEAIDRNFPQGVRSVSNGPTEVAFEWKGCFVKFFLTEHGRLQFQGPWASSYAPPQRNSSTDPPPQRQESSPPSLVRQAILDSRRQESNTAFDRQISAFNRQISDLDSQIANLDRQRVQVIKDMDDKWVELLEVLGGNGDRRRKQRLEESDRKLKILTARQEELEARRTRLRDEVRYERERKLQAAERLRQLETERVNPSTRPGRTASNTFQGSCSRAIESQISGEFNGWDGETVFVLTNGQIWQQSSYAYHYHYAYRPEVLIYPSQDGSCKLKVDGVSKTITVKNLR